MKLTTTKNSCLFKVDLSTLHSSSSSLTLLNKITLHSTTVSSLFMPEIFWFRYHFTPKLISKFLFSRCAIFDRITLWDLTVGSSHDRFPFELEHSSVDGGLKMIWLCLWWSMMAFSWTFTLEDLSLRLLKELYFGASCRTQLEYTFVKSSYSTTVAKGSSSFVHVV